jgi:hypothetical protein
MNEVLLSQDMHKTIVTLYASMIGVFGTTAGSGTNMHVGHIKTIEIVTDKSGKHSLVIKTEYRTFLNTGVDAAAVVKLKSWVAEVQRAKQAIAL